MLSLSEKQIWDEVFDGSIQTAIEWTRSQQRNALTGTELSARKSSKPLALYLEPSLNSANGHQLTLANCYQELFAKLGYQTRIIHALKNTLGPNSDRIPHFLVKHHTMSSRNICSLADLEDVETYFQAEFQSLVENYKPDVCVFATTRFTNIFPAAKSVTNRDVKSVIFGVMEAAEVPDCNDLAIIKSAYTRAATLLKQHQVPHLLIAENALIKDFLLGCGFNNESVKVFPYVAASLINSTSDDSIQPSSQIQIGYLGGSRAVRHPELIADLVVLGNYPKSVNLNVQLDLGYILNKRGQNVCDKINELHESGSIKLHPPGLSNQQYRSLFCSLDFIILPYSERYQQIGSGILLEAIYAGVTPILPMNSKMNEIYTSLGGQAPLIESLSAEAINDAVMDGLSRYPTLKETALTIREKWQQHPSSAEQWQSELTKWLRS